MTTQSFGYRRSLISDARNNLSGEERALLVAAGWDRIMIARSAISVYSKTLPDGRVAICDRETALTIEEAISNGRY